MTHTRLPLISRRNGLVSEWITLGFIVIATIAVISKLLSLISKKSKQISRNNLDAIPKLSSLRVIKQLYTFVHKRNDLPSLMTKWRREYGPCWRLNLFGNKVVFIHDPALLRSFLTSSQIGHLEKYSFVYDNLIVGAGNNGLLSMPAKCWIPHRKILNTRFTYENLKSYIPIFRKHAEKLAEELKTEENVGTQKTLSYGKLVHLKTLDIIAEIATGVPLENTLGRKGSLIFHENLQAVMEIIAARFTTKPWQLIPIVWKFHPLRRKMESDLDYIETSVDEIRKKHVTQPESKFALDLMINSNWSDGEIVSELLTMIIGGHETASTNIVLHFWMMALEQEHQIACQQEVDKVFDSLESTGQELSLSRLSEMKYLERCVKESLRLFTSTPFGTARELKTPITLEGDITLQPGTIVTFSTYILHRDPTVFPDPEKFDPDRFLPENMRNRHAYAYLPFSSGPRNCLGWKLAPLELTVLSAVILRHFHLHTTDKREDIKIMFGCNLYPSRTPNVTFERRR